jgi:hypothetical protein
MGASLAVGGCRDAIFQRAKEAVAGELRNADQLGSLNVSSNPLGAGVIVYANTTTRCEPEYVWIAFDSDGAYALDDATRRWTPKLRIIAEAKSGIQEGAGLASESVRNSLRSRLCKELH